MNFRPALIAAPPLSIVPKPVAPVRKPGTWGPLAEPVDPLDTWTRARAQSLLTGMHFRDGSSSPDTIPIDQARDLVRWSSPQT